MRQMSTAKLEQRELARLAAEPTANSFFYIDPQVSFITGTNTGPCRVTHCCVPPP